MTPERFQREVAERRAREGVWDGRSTPAVLAAARQAPPAAAAVPAEVPQDLVTTPQWFRAELAARRAADRQRRPPSMYA